MRNTSRNSRTAGSGRGRSHLLLHPVEHFHPADALGDALQKPRVGPLARNAGQSSSHPLGIAAAHGFKQFGPACALDAQRSHDAAQKRPVAERYAKILHPVLLETLHGDGNHLRVGLKRNQADELHARLPELALQLTRHVGVAKDVRRVGETQRPGVGGQNRARRPRDLGRHVGAQGEESPAFEVHHAVGLGVEHFRSRPGDVELKRRREELAEPPLLKDAQQTLLYVPLAPGLARQEHPRTARNGSRRSRAPHAKPSRTRQAS